MKALVLGTVGNEVHDEAVRTYYLEQNPADTCHLCLIGTGTPAGNIVAYQANIAGCVQYAVDNDYDIIIRSYTGVASYLLEWEEAYSNGIIVFHAHAANTFTRFASPADLYAGLVCLGGGQLQNERSYGPGLEFYDATNQGFTEESWATPTAAGKYSLVKQTVETALAKTLTPWQIRYAMRVTSVRNATTHAVGAWNEENGFGRPDEDEAQRFLLNFSDDIPLEEGFDQNLEVKGIESTIETLLGEGGYSKPILKIFADRLVKAELEIYIDKTTEEDVQNYKPLASEMYEFTLDKYVHDLVVQQLTSKVTELNNAVIIRE